MITSSVFLTFLHRKSNTDAHYSPYKYGGIRYDYCGKDKDKHNSPTIPICLFFIIVADGVDGAASARACDDCFRIYFQLGSNSV